MRNGIHNLKNNSLFVTFFLVLQGRACCCESPQGQICSFQSSYSNITRSNSNQSRHCDYVKYIYQTSTDRELEKEHPGSLDAICPICLEAFRVDEALAWSLRLASCPHAFHSMCLQRWLESLHYDGPCCRGDFQCQSYQQSVLQKLRQGHFCTAHGLIFSP